LNKVFDQNYKYELNQNQDYTFKFTSFAKFYCNNMLWIIA